MTASCFRWRRMAGGTELGRPRRKQAFMHDGPSTTLAPSRRGGFGAGEERGWSEPDWSGRNPRRRDPGWREPEQREPGRRGPGWPSQGPPVQHHRPPRGPRRRARLFAVVAVLSTAVVTASILAAYLYRGRTAPEADPAAGPQHAAASQ